MFSLRAACSRALPTATRAVNRRAFSSDCEPAQRIRTVLEEYRQEHFSRELPSRFRKEVVKAISSGDGSVEVDSLNQILLNIDRKDALLDEGELLQLLQEVGADRNTRKVSVDKIMQLM